VALSASTQPASTTSGAAVILSATTATQQDIQNAALSRFQVLRDQYIKEGTPLRAAEQRAAAETDRIFDTHLTNSIPALPPPPPEVGSTSTTAGPPVSGVDTDTLVNQATSQVSSTATTTPIYDRYVRSAFQTGPTPLYDTYVSGSGFSGPRTPLYNRYVGETQRVPDSVAAMQQRPDYPIHFPEEKHVGPFDDTILGAAAQLKNALLGAVNLVAGPPVPAGVPVSKFGAVTQKSVEAQTGQPFTLTDEQMAQNRTAAAFIASSLVGGATADVILAKMASTVGKGMLAGTAAGATFGALRPRDQKESLMHAILMDAALFGGMSLAGGLVGKLTQPIKIGVDDLERSGIPIEQVASRGPEFGKALFEEVQGIAGNLTGTPPLVQLDDAIAGLNDVSVAQVPANIGVLRRYFGSPSKWKNVGGVVGDAAQRVTENASQRMALALRERGAWESILNDAESLIARDIPGVLNQAEDFGAGHAVAMQAQKQAFGKLLDNVFQPTDLPVTISPNMARAFELVRGRLLADRETLKLLVGGTADWGIDAYLPHVFVGDWAVTDAVTKQIYKIVGIGDIRSAAAQVLADNPGAQLRIVPKQFMMPAELAGLGLTGRALGTFISKAASALSVDRDEIASVLFENKVARLKPGKKFFSHTLARGEPPLEGFETDPFTALRIYAAGATRKMAFHDFEQKAGAIIDQLSSTPGTATSTQALKVYVDRVMGRPSELETATRSTFQEIARRMTAPLSPGIQQFAAEMADPRVLMGKVNQFEAFARLGYSPVAWYTNLSQTLVNTSSAIGWGPTMRGIRLFLDRSQQPQVDALLRALDIDLAVPLSAADQIVTRNVGQVSPWHPLYLFNKVETANRAIAALSKYQEQILKGADIRQALESSRQFVRDTQFDYSLADAPRLLQGPLGASVFQFKKFVLKEMEFMWSLRNNPAAIARFTTNVWAIGGVGALFALPPLILLDWASGELSGEKLSEKIQAAFPRASRGLPGFAGIDLGGNIAIGLPRETGDVFGPGVIDMWDFARDAIGKQGIDLIRGKQGHLTPTERAQLISGLVPVMVRRLMDSYDILNKGVVTTRGSVQLKYRPQDVAREATLAAFGFRSLPMAEEARVTTTIRRQVQLQQQDEQAVVQAWANHYVAGENEQATKVLQDAQTEGLLITREQLRDALAGAIMERSTRAMKNAPPELRLQELQRLQQLQQQIPH